MDLDWDGLVNGRDVAGMPLANGTRIEPGRLIRCASPHTLTPTGWRQLHDYGVRTVVNLMNDAETADRAPLHSGAIGGDVTLARAQMEPDGYTREWADRSEQWKLGTPRYYDDFVTRYPERVAAVLNTIAFAEGGTVSDDGGDNRDGGVLVHCGSGRDRCGLAIAMTLDLVGVDPLAIAADHWLSYRGSDPRISVGGTSVGEDGILEGRELDSADHAAAIQQLLADHPATSCFSTAADADTVRAALLARLCGSSS